MGFVNESFVVVLAESFFSANAAVEIGPVVESGDRDECRAGLAEAFIGKVVAFGSALLDCGENYVFLEVEILAILFGAHLSDENANHLGYVGAGVGQAELGHDDVDVAMPARSAIEDAHADSRQVLDLILQLGVGVNG